MRVMSSNDREITLVRALVHGDSKIGKTTSLKTLPEKHTLVVSVERGLVPLRDKAFRVVAIESWDDLRALVSAFMRAETAEDGSVTLELDGQTIEGVKVLAIDSMTECNTLCKRQIVEVDRRKLIHARTEGKRDQVDTIYDEQMQQEDWGVLSTRMAQFIGAINRLPVHVVWTSLSSWKEDRKTGQTHRLPALNGALATEVPAFFDVVLHMEAQTDTEGNDARVWRTFNDGIHLCGDASGALDPFEAPDWGRVFKKILSPAKTTEAA